MKKTIRNSVLLILIALLTACGNTEETSSKTSDGTDTEAGVTTESNSSDSDEKTFVQAIDYMPAHLRPNFGSDSVTEIVRPIFDQLYVEVKDDIEYRIAESLEISDDGKTYTVKIHPDANWSDGEPITAEDILFSIEFGAHTSGGTSSLTHVNGEEVGFNIIDDKTLEIVLPEVQNYYILNLQFLGVIASHPFDGDVTKVESSDYYSQPGCAVSGAYEVAEINPDSLVLVARDDYYRGRPSVDKVIMKVLGEGSTQNVAFENGELSYTRVNTAQELEKYENQPDKYNVYSWDEGRINYLQINPYGKNISQFDEDARKAIFLAIDPQQIVDGAYGSEKLASTANSVVEPLQDLYDPNAPGYSQNLEEAKKLSKESGLEGTTLTYIYNKDRANMEEISIVMQQQLAEIGVNLQIEALDSPTFFARFWEGSPETNDVGTDWDLGSNGWGQMRGRSLAQTGFYLNNERWGWSDDMIELCESINSDPNFDSAKEKAKELQAKYTEEYWMYPLAYPNITFVSHSNISGIDSTIVVPEFFDYNSIEIE